MVAVAHTRRAILWSLTGALISCARGEDVSGLGFGASGAADGGPDVAASGGDAGSSTASGGSGATAGGSSGSGGASGTSGTGGSGGSSGVGSGGGSGTGGSATAIPFPYTPSNFDPAALSAHAAPTVLDCGESVFDSTSSTFTNWCGQTEPAAEVVTAGGSEIVVLAIDGLEIASGSTLRIMGDRPVVLAIFGDATIAGTIDASADGAAPGAGGNLACGSSTGTNGSGSSSSGGGGGGGGGFGTQGGNGGSGDGSGVGTGGDARGNDTLAPLIGGCGGGMGGGCTNEGGAGGGALQIAVAGALHVTGAVLSNGGQGTGGCGSEGGGSGGGSGGGILLEGATIDVATGAEVTANGGDGGDGRNGGNGGSGGTATAAAQNGENDGANGGGGGGGAVGRIRFNAATSCTLSGAVSPAATGSC